jgi:hypothetical protein
MNFVYLFIYSISFNVFIYMTQQMGQLVAASCPFIALPQPNAVGLVDFQAILSLL